MTWKSEARGLLERLTGYQLTRVNGHGRTQGRATAVQARPAKRAQSQKYALPKDMDERAKQIIRSVRRRTMTSSDKLFGLISSVRYIVQHQIPGAIVECGVWRGGSMQAAAMTLLDAGVTDRDLYLFDTFEGMPAPSEHDKRHDGRSAEELLATHERTAAVWAVASLEDVRQGMQDVAYPSERIHYVEGLVEQTVPDKAPQQISILRLDTDWYQSTQHELKHLYPRLSPGGVLIIDDYGWWQGARKATDEFLRESGERLLLLRISGGRIAVKP